MNAQPHIFLSCLPDLGEHVTIIAEITTSGPHLLNSACCRALLRRTTNLLSSPALHNKKRVYLVVHKNEVKKTEFRESVAACNLQFVNVTQLTQSILQYCLDFTVHTYLHPKWTRVDNKYLQGKTCLFQNTWMSCVRAQVNVQDKSVILAVRATLMKLVVARLSTFHIRDDIIQEFMKKKIRTIKGSDMGDNTCYVLPSFKPALVHSISYDIAESCPLKDRSDMIAYWLDYHGMLIPSDTDIFVSLSFNFPGAPIMTYPYYCIRKSYAILKQSTHSSSIASFIGDVNSVIKSKLPDLQLHFPVNPSFCTAPDKSDDCLTTEPAQKLNVNNDSTIAVPQTNRPPVSNKDIIMPLGKNKNVSVPDLKPIIRSEVERIKPCFNTSHSTRCETPFSDSISKESVQTGKVVPNFKSAGTIETHAGSSSRTATRPQTHQNKVQPNFNIRPTNPVQDTRTSSVSCSSVQQNQRPGTPKTNVVLTPKNSWSSQNKITKSQSKIKNSNQHAYASPISIILSSFDPEDLDDFESPNPIVKKPRNSQPKNPRTPLSTPTRKLDAPLSGTRKHSPICQTPESLQLPKKKQKTAPKIMDEVEIAKMFRIGQLGKVNSQSLSAFLRKNCYKGAVSKLKKEQLVSEAVKYLRQPEPVREL